MRIQRSRLYHAVKLAVECQEKLEREKFDYKHDSRFLAELRDLLHALKFNDNIEVVGSIPGSIPHP